MSRNLWMISLMIVAILISSCAPRSTPTTSQQSGSEATSVAEPTEPAAIPAEKVKIEMWLGPWFECFKPIIAEKINPNAKTFELVTVDVSSGDTLRPALSAGGGPDIVTVSGPTEAREYSIAGLNVPLDPYIEKYGWDKLFPPWALNLSAVEGKRFSIQAELEAMILFYNKTLFEKKGYQPPKTFDEMLALAEQMNKDGIIPFGSAVGGGMKWPDDYVYAEYLNAIAGPEAVYEALTGKRSWTDPVFVETFTLLKEQAQAGWFMGGLDAYFTKTWDEQLLAIAKGEAGMAIQGTWLFPDVENDYFKDTGNTWDWAPMPRKDGRVVFDIGLGSAWSINKFSKHPDEAAEFLNMWFQPELQIELLKSHCIAPAPIVIPEETMADLDSRVSSFYKALNEAFAKGDYGYTTWTFWPPNLQVYMQKGLEEIYNDQLTVDDYLKEADRIMKEELAAGAAPPIPDR